MREGSVVFNDGREVSVENTEKFEEGRLEGGREGVREGRAKHN